GLTPLNSYENRVYQFQDEERHRYVVKFYRPERWSAEQILEEHLTRFQQVLLHANFRAGSKALFAARLVQAPQIAANPFHLIKV
ncbi:phosphotransferase, partial [Klebsiella pneumoniae]|uniref:phosphotransferase n=1 Tax=Klebsiella pneumoniae TaxID=573 RepID=UPI001F1971E8